MSYGKANEIELVKYLFLPGYEITQTVIMPNSFHAVASGQCQNDLSSIHIAWGKYYYVDAHFATMKTAKRDSSEVHWKTVNLTISVQLTNNTAFADAGGTEIIATENNQANLEWLSGANGHSLNCSQDTVQLGSNITATFENMRIQPFGVEKNSFSEKVDICNPHPTTKPTEAPSKKSSNTVAIAVGCSLAGLVVIVLIGYFIGQRRKNSIRYRKL
ncbi:hypothetical protein QZH41_020296 [Actinostola sp. cb2023]|nr:hypothetical protein QZH41_020296 [Actinostola sp. cb2023]